MVPARCQAAMGLSCGHNGGRLLSTYRTSACLHNLSRSRVAAPSKTWFDYLAASLAMASLRVQTMAVLSSRVCNDAKTFAPKVHCVQDSDVCSMLYIADLSGTADFVPGQHASCECLDVVRGPLVSYGCVG